MNFVGFKKEKKTIFLAFGLFVSIQSLTVFASQDPVPHWQVYKFDRFHFSIKSPDLLEKSSENRDVNNELIFVNPKVDGKEPVFKIFICAESHLKKTDFPNGIELKEIPDQILGYMQEKKMISDVHVASNLTTIDSGEKGVLSIGICTAHGLKKKMIMLNVKQGEAWWQVIIQFDYYSKAQREMAFDSVASFRIIK